MQGEEYSEHPPSPKKYFGNVTRIVDVDAHDLFRGQRGQHQRFVWRLTVIHVDRGVGTVAPKRVAQPSVPASGTRILDNVSGESVSRARTREHGADAILCG